MPQPNPERLTALDLFAGIGGSSCGVEMADVKVVGAVDTWTLARKTYQDNFEDVKYYKHRCETLDPRDVKREIGSIDLLLASPECTSHTCAKGSAPRSEPSRRTAFQVVRFAEVLMPRWIIVENVIHMRSWHRFDEWIDELHELGYNINQQILNSADFNVPQSRRRLFITGDLENEPCDAIVPAPDGFLTADSLIDKNGTYRYSPLRTKRRAKATLQRAERAINELGNESPFLLVYYGTDGSGGWQRVDRPLRTITTVDRFAYVRPSADGAHEMRMLQVPELKKAMGFPCDYELNRGTRRDQIKLLGNAVCPPVMKAVVKTLTGKSALR